MSIRLFQSLPNFTSHSPHHVSFSFYLVLRSCSF
jgi:hypothetical protein